MIGRVLAHYEVVDSLGKGGMGEVYVDEDKKLQRRVALKVLPKEVADEPERRSRFEREARAVAALNHPNIVTVYSVEEADGLLFITMELVEGKTLAKKLPRNGFALSELLETAIPLADAVSSAHRSGITHRDLKPDNIMIDGEGRLRVLDFGLAKWQDPAVLDKGESQAPTATILTEEGKILGTVAYMSPEQAEGKIVDSRSDIFSLGTILFEMATGKRPFQGDTSMSTISSILRDNPALVTELSTSLPHHLGRIIRRCLAKDPERRYQTALDLRNELEDLKGELDSGEIRSTAIRPARTIENRLLIGVVALICVAAIFVATRWKKPDSVETGYTYRPLTSTFVYEGDVGWSPEAEFITFGRMRDGNLDIMVQSVSGGDAVVRASGPGDETSPRWSPDGNFIAYVSSSDPESSIFLVPPHGGAPRRLIDTKIPTLDIERLSVSMGDRPWSPDSGTLLVSRLSEMGQSAIYRIDRKSGGAQQLTFPPTGSADLSPSYSFDGAKIVFQRRNDGRGALWTMADSGSDQQPLLADEFDNLTPAWRPDGRHIVFRSYRGGMALAGIWEISVSGGTLRQLTFETNEIFSFSVSSDNRIAYVPYWHDTFLFSVNVTTRDRRQLTFHTKDNVGARYSPDGRKIAYHSTRTGNSEIWVHSVDDQAETQITYTAAWDLYPDWSPDGRQLTFVSDREDEQFKIFIANSDGGGERLLVDQPITLRSPWSPVNAALVSRWSPDGDQIAFLVSGEDSTDLWTTPANGQGARQLLENVMGFDWYRDSRHGVIERQHGSETELVAVDLETGQEQSLFVGPLTEMDVAPDGSAIAFCFGPGHMAMGLAILKLEPPSDPDGLPQALGEPEYVVRTEGTWHVHNGGWSPDSQNLVYTQDVDYGDIYELVERQ